MIDKIESIIKILEPVLLVIVPLVFGIYFKLKVKILDKKLEISNAQKEKNKDKLIDWQHEESLRVFHKLQEVSNYFCDIVNEGVCVSYIQIENGTVATSKLSNMFLSCAAEDTRYITVNQPLKIAKSIQRVPFILLSKWFMKVFESPDTWVVLRKDDVDNILQELKIGTMISSLVRDPNGIVVGVCNFCFYSDKFEVTEKITSNLLKYVSSIETIILGYDVGLNMKEKELHIIEDDEDIINVEHISGLFEFPDVKKEEK